MAKEAAALQELTYGQLLEATGHNTPKTAYRPTHNDFSSLDFWAAFHNAPEVR